MYLVILELLILNLKIKESDNILKNVGSESLIHHLILIPGINAMTFPGER